MLPDLQPGLPALFQDLVQRLSEYIHDYYLRVTESFRRKCEAKANTIEDIRAIAPDGMANTDEVRAQLSTVKKEGLIDMERFFLHQHHHRIKR